VNEFISVRRIRPRMERGMAKAVVDPTELRRFAHGLKHFNSELQHALAVLNGQFSALGDTWRDQEHEKFAREFLQTMQVLSQFVATANEHIPFLLRKAERIEEYLQQH
ncbi:MAG TPA: WXG100 family type VII secretion target, partial [Gemmataceae bacterium]|nr:WXG100 family type VII secretion target [Gemmataceae bacterium]